MTISAVTVLGGGAWGLTLADLLSRKGLAVTLWDRNSDVLSLLAKDRTRGTPAGLVIHDRIRFNGDLCSSVSRAQMVVCAVPSYAIRSVCSQLGQLTQAPRRQVFVSCSKGIEEDTLFLPSQIFEQMLGSRRDMVFAVLAGPSHAEEVSRNLPTVVVCCSSDAGTAEQVRDAFFVPTFRVYTQSDCRGVELGGALKNVIAIAAGMCDGLGFGDNTKAALITRGLAEIARAGIAMGAQAQTLSGLSGLGDLIVTATSRHSRNRLFGELLAKGRNPEQALGEIGAAVEGYRTCRSAWQLARKFEVEMPLIQAIYSVLYEKAHLETAVNALLQREPRPEIY